MSLFVSAGNPTGFSYQPSREESENCCCNIIGCPISAMEASSNIGDEGCRDCCNGKKLEGCAKISCCAVGTAVSGAALVAVTVGTLAAIIFGIGMAIQTGPQVCYGDEDGGLRYCTNLT